MSKEIRQKYKAKLKNKNQFRNCQYAQFQRKTDEECIFDDPWMFLT